MAAKDEDGRLSNNQIARLAAAISSRNMETIAVAYLGFDDEEIKSLEDENPGQPERINRNIARKWANNNSNCYQTKNLASLLYKAANDEGYVDPQKIERILGVTQEEAVTAISDPSAEPTGNELQSLVHHLQHRTKEEVKPEMAPWAKDHTPGTNDIRIKLNITKQDKEVTHKTTENYHEFFVEAKEGNSKDRLLRAYAMKNIVSKGKGKKVLVSSRSRMGKSMLGKKIAHDWARGQCTAYPIVLLVSLKIANPGDAIKNIIVDQYRLRDRNVSQEKVQFILETFGQECLLVIDDFDGNCAKKNS